MSVLSHSIDYYQTPIGNNGLPDLVIVSARLVEGRNQNELLVEGFIVPSEVGRGRNHYHAYSSIAFSIDSVDFHQAMMREHLAREVHAMRMTEGFRPQEITLQEFDMERLKVLLALEYYPGLAGVLDQTNFQGMRDQARVWKDVPFVTIEKRWPQQR